MIVPVFHPKAGILSGNTTTGVLEQLEKPVKKKKKKKWTGLCYDCKIFKQSQIETVYIIVNAYTYEVLLGNLRMRNVVLIVQWKFKRYVDFSKYERV